ENSSVLARSSSANPHDRKSQRLSSSQNINDKWFLAVLQGLLKCSSRGQLSRKTARTVNPAGFRQRTEKTTPEVQNDPAYIVCVIASKLRIQASAQSRSISARMLEPQRGA